MKVELNKKYRYRNGEPARVLCVDAPGEQPVVSISEVDGRATNHGTDGRFFTSNRDSVFDLIEVID